MKITLSFHKESIGTWVPDQEYIVVEGSGILEINPTQLENVVKIGFFKTSFSVKIEVNDYIVEDDIAKKYAKIIISMMSQEKLPIENVEEVTIVDRLTHTKLSKEIFR